MRKYIFAVLVVLLLCLLLPSCGGKGMKGMKHAGRDLRNSVKQQLTGGKQTSGGPLLRG